MILINPCPKNSLGVAQMFLPVWVPVGIGCLLAVTEREGIKTYFVDEQIEKDPLKAIASYVGKMQKPYIFGFSVLTQALRRAIDLSRQLKERYPDSVIIFGGIHPTAAPEDILCHDHVDVVLRGEADKLITDFYRHVKGNKDFRALDGISYKKDGKIIHNQRAPIITDIDALPPFPYHQFTSPRYDLAFVVSSRGCPYQCIFCSNRVTTDKKYRYRRAESVVEELLFLHEKHHIKFVIFLDDNFCVSKERVYGLIDAIKKKGLDEKMTFSFQSRGDNVDRRLLQDLFDTGFKSIFFGLETSSERIMKVIKKGETLAQCLEAVKMAKQIGFYVSATFIYGLPSETHEDRIRCVELTREYELDMVRYNNATPYPGTELHEIAQRQDRLNVQGLYDNFCSASTFVENPFKRIPFTYVPEGNTEEEIRRDILFSYFSFFFNVDRLKTIFVTPDKGAGYFNAGDNIAAFLLRRLPALIFFGFMLMMKFFNLFYYMIIKKETRTSLKDFCKVFG